MNTSYQTRLPYYTRSIKQRQSKMKQHKITLTNLYKNFYNLLPSININLLLINNHSINNNNYINNNQQQSVKEMSKKGEYKQLKDEVEKMCKCSIKTRLIGYVACFIVGWLLSIVASIMFFVKHDIPAFCILFSIGQILNITGSCFLATPKTQAKDMFKKRRIWFTVAYLGSTLMTIILAVTLPANLRSLIMISLIIEIISYFFYTLTFIPFGQKIMSKLFKTMTDQD